MRVQLLCVNLKPCLNFTRQFTFHVLPSVQFCTLSCPVLFTTTSTIVGILTKREYLGYTVNFKTQKHFKDM